MHGGHHGGECHHSAKVAVVGTRIIILALRAGISGIEAVGESINSLWELVQATMRPESLSAATFF